MKDSKFLHEYPYTDFHELNTDWIINEVGKIIDSINVLSKKIDDVVDKQKELDNKIDDVVKHVDDVEKHVDDVEKKVDETKTKVDDQDTKVNEVTEKANENQTKVNDSVKSVTYDNELNVSDDNVKLIGRIHVDKPNTGDVATPVYGYVGGGVLGNCVVWSKSPYVGVGEQKDYVMKNPTGDTLMEFPINGSFLAVCGDKYIVISDGSLIGNKDSFVRAGAMLITPDSFVALWYNNDQSHDTRIMTPKVASGIKFEDATYPLDAGRHDVSIPYNSDHLYLISDADIGAYAINGSITIFRDNNTRTLKIENDMLVYHNTTNWSDSLIMLDLGSMV